MSAAKDTGSSWSGCSNGGFADGRNRRPHHQWERLRLRRLDRWRPLWLLLSLRFCAWVVELDEDEPEEAGADGSSSRAFLTAAADPSRIDFSTARAAADAEVKIS
jgi:hypothetical protein